MRPALDPVTRQARLLVDPAKHTTYESVRDAVLDGVTGFFRTQLGRPELLNRIGHNIVVFDFIREAVMRQILVGKVLPSVAENVLERWRIEVKFSEQVERDILTWAGSDVANGGRGIGNLTERALVNPLARVLYRATSEASRKAGPGTRYPLAGATLRVSCILPPGASEDQRYDIEWEFVPSDRPA
jgi:ATP-dependent Clp protease ATP-binding subunit ClpA